MKTTHKKHVGKTCEAARIAKGWTINRTATESGLRAHQIEGIEDGSKSYTFDSLVQLCSVLGITIEVYFGQKP
jgi:transcriptional regulator with XRE-family HTH domain